jgi:preprotein translocase subunit SecA
MLADSFELMAGRPYVERAEQEPAMHDKVAEVLIANLLRPARARLNNPANSLGKILNHVSRHEGIMRKASDCDLARKASGLRCRFRRDGFAPALVGETFALVREAAGRTLGQRHYEIQLMAGWALLQGKLIEMATGEGKTITATLPVSAVALAGFPVHVVTVNDYLAKRDAEEMGPLYRFLGLEVGAVVQGMARPQRREAYGKSVTYCTNKELAFDYLRDSVALARRSTRLHLSLERMAGGNRRDLDLVLRGLYFAVVDEADSVLIDEARTPLILSAGTGAMEEREECERALAIASSLVASLDYAIDWADRRITLTAAGKTKLRALADPLNGIWTSTRASEELVSQALSAQILFRRDQHYVIAEGKVQIVDESTGRVMPDRSWERGLHQLIEAKEGTEPTQRRETLARLTYQRLFRRYLRLAGMTGTAKEVAREIRSVYGLDVVRIPLHRPSRLQYRPTTVCASEDEKWQAVATAVGRISAMGRPVLIGTRSVKASEQVSKLLVARGIDHALLNAKQDQMEAEIIALAGQPHRITVATNMAGRGTDIRLGEGVAELGGLYVILTEYHDSRRVDRQFFGRCARQGDPGSCEAIVSLEDELFVINAPLLTRLAGLFTWRSAALPAMLYQGLRFIAQLRAERRHCYVRTQTLKLDKRLEQMLAFSGTGE